MYASRTLIYTDHKEQGLLKGRNTMRVLKIMLSLISPVALLLPVLSCGGGPHETTEVYYLVATNIKISYWQAAKAGLEKSASKMGVKFDFVGPDTYDPKAEVEQFRRVLSQRPTPSGILVSAADPQLMKPAIDQAIAQGIPVITVDADAPSSKRMFYIGTDNYQAGKLGAGVAVKELNGKGNVVVYTMPEQTNLQDRLRGYRDVFDQNPGVKITEVVDIQGNPALAFDKTMEIVRKSIKDVDAFVCLEAIACKEVAEVLDREHITGKVIVAMDTDDLTLKWIEKGAIAATVAQKPFTMAYVGVEMLDDLHHNMPPSLEVRWKQDPLSPIPSFVDTGTFLVDKSNVTEFMRAQQSALEGT
jgi:ribose transport system substrate-binding protein